MIQSYEFKTIGGDEIESKVFSIGGEPDLMSGDIISVRYSGYDFSLMFEATADEMVKALSDEDAHKYEDSVALETDTTTTHETRGTFYIVDDEGIRLIGDGLWYAHENRTIFFDIYEQHTEIYRREEKPFTSHRLNDVLDYELYWELRRPQRVDHIVHSLKHH